MAITLNGLITIQRISSRGTVTRIGDGGALERTLAYSGQTAKRWHTLAQAKAIERQLHELADYSRAADGVYISSTEYDLDAGLYRIVSVDTKTTPESVSATFIVDIDLQLVRLGGAGAGGNLDRRIVPSPSLQSNSWSIGALPWYALPTTVTEALDVSIGQFLTSADGNTPLVQSSSAGRYVLNAASYGVGECKAWDTAGDFDPASFTPSTWTRVLGKDYKYAQPYHWAVDNGFIRLTAQHNVPASAYGVMLEYYDPVATAWKPMSTSTSANNHIVCQFNGTAPTAWKHSQLIEVTPERVKVKVWMTASTFLPTITYTLERGKQWCLVETTSASSTTLGIGLLCTNSRYVFNRFVPASTTLGGAYATGPSNDCINHSFPATTAWTANQVASGTNGDNWIGSAHPSVDVMRFVAVRSTSVGLTKPGTTNGGLLASQASVTSLAAYVGAFYYAASRVLNVEAEAGTLTGADTPANDANASGAGNNYVRFDANAEQIEIRPASTPYAFGATSGLRLRAYWRVQNAASSASNGLTMALWNNTTSANLALTTTGATITDAILGTAGTGASNWKWISCETVAWNGTDTVYPRLTRTAVNTDAVKVDECVLVCLGNGLLGGAYDKAHAALTEMTTMQVATVVTR